MSAPRRALCGIGDLVRRGNCSVDGVPSLEPNAPGKRQYARSKGGETNISINAPRPYLIHALGALGGAAVGVLVNVYAGVPPGGPLVAPTIGAVAGGAAVHWLPAKTLESPAVRRVGLGVLAVLVGLAAVYVVAAIALSNFE